jgi:MFS family permease
VRKWHSRSSRPRRYVRPVKATRCAGAVREGLDQLIRPTQDCAMPTNMAAVSVYSVEGLAGLGGRLLLGLLGDRFGAKPVLIAGLLVQAAAIGSYVFVSRLGEFYALAVIFGTAYGSVMPLYAVLAREYFGQHIMGTVFGAATMLSSLGMAFGPLAGGWIFDTFDAYSWLFIGSFAVGLGAVAVALAFPPLPRERLQPA